MGIWLSTYGHEAETRACAQAPCTSPQTQTPKHHGLCVWLSSCVCVCVCVGVCVCVCVCVSSHSMAPLLDWEREAADTIDSLKSRLSTCEASLQLAASERDALLRENDKIILHYRKVRIVVISRMTHTHTHTRFIAGGDHTLQRVQYNMQ